MPASVCLCVCGRVCVCVGGGGFEVASFLLSVYKEILQNCFVKTTRSI